MDDKADPELRRTLDQLGDRDSIEVLVYPSGNPDDLVAHLADQREAGDLEFNVLALAECIAVRARRPTIDAIAGRVDVARVAVNPTFTTNTPS